MLPTLLTACLALGACHAQPTTRAQAPGGAVVAQALPPAVAPSTAPGAQAPELAHDGGIVYLGALDTLADDASKSTAAALGTALGLGLRTERTMRDAELLLASEEGPTAAAFALLANENQPAAAGPPSARPEQANAKAEPGARNVNAADKPDPAATQGPGAAPEKPESPAKPEKSEKPEKPAGEKPSAQVAAQAARAAWQALSPEERQRVKQSHEAREAKLLARLTVKLAERKRHFARQGDDTRVPDADGGAEVTSRFVVNSAEGPLSVTVTRRYDAEGLLLQSVQALAGTRGATAFAATRSRTLGVDGGVVIVSDIRLTAAGAARTLHWEKAVAPDGTLTATGTLTRPDGTTLDLTGAGSEDGVETLAGADAGVRVTLTADAAADDATATVEAGAAGSATLTLPLEVPEDAGNPGAEGL